MDEPTLRQSVDGKALIEAGTHAAEDDGSRLAIIDPEVLVLFEEYSENQKVIALHQEYVKSKWLPWATQEKKRLKVIRLYAQLFTLKQQLEGRIVEAELELAWGIGVGIWKTDLAPGKWIP